MTIRCVPRPQTYGFAHVCDECGIPGPIVGVLDQSQDAAEMEKLGFLPCQYPESPCMASAAGWLVGQRDLCPSCRKTQGKSTIPP